MRLLFAIILCAVFTATFAQAPDTLWTRTYGGSSYEECYSVQQTADGGFILGGRTNSFGAGSSDFYLVKTDGNGNQQWSRTFGGSSYDECRAVEQTTDGGYILAGYTGSFYVGNYDFWLVKTDANGDSLWSRTFGQGTIDFFNSVQQTTDGGYILAGKTSLSGDDFYLVKTDGNGNQQWSRTFGGSNQEYCNSVQQTADGGFILAGLTMSFGAGSLDYYLVKTDGNGNQQWSRTFGGSYSERCKSVQQTTDGGYILAGDKDSFGHGNSEFWLVKTDANGDSLWSRTYGGGVDDHCNSVRQTTDGGYILAGNKDLSGGGSNHFWLIKTDASGNGLWDRSFGGGGADECWSVQQTSDGGFVLAGSTSSFGAGEWDCWLVKTGPEVGTSVCGSVSGVWDMAHSPYYVACDVAVPAGQTLTIEPGVHVLFTGHYKFNVLGNLQAIGTEQDSIVFTRAFPTEECKWWGVRLQGQEASQSRMAYCVIEHGHATPGAANLDNCGGALFVDQCSPTVASCTIRNNYAEGNGGGILCTNGAAPVFESCLISSNSASFGGGFQSRQGSTPLIRDCVIDGNDAYFAYGGGLQISFSSLPLITGCTITNNHSTWCGAGVFVEEHAEAHLENCTVTQNTAGTEGGGICIVNTGIGFVKNSIIWANNGIGAQYWGNPQVTYSDIQGGYIGTGNIDADPLFVDAANGDFHLQESSPCIDAGDPNSPHDPDSTIADMGAFYNPQSPLLFVSPPEVNFGLQDIGADSTATVALYNPGGVPTIISEISHTVAIFHVDTSGLNMHVNPNSTYNVHVTFAPTVAGSYYDELMIVAQRAGDDTVVIPLYGDAAVLAVTPEHLVIKRGTGNNIKLHWDPVTHTLSGQPLVDPLYHVYVAGSEAGPFVEFGVSDSTGFVHPGIVAGPGKLFYRVTAAAN